MDNRCLEVSHDSFISYIKSFDVLGLFCRGKRSFWLTCFIILGVCLSFAGVVLFIRLTRAVGYTAAPRFRANPNTEL